MSFRYSLSSIFIWLSIQFQNNIIRFTYQCIKWFTTFYVLNIIYIYIKGILRGYAIRSGRRPEGSQRPQGGPCGPPRPLTSRGTSAWPYRVTTQYSFYPVQMYSWHNKTWKMKLGNYKSNDLPANGLPTHAWSRQISHQLDKVSEDGPSIYAFIE